MVTHEDIQKIAKLAKLEVEDDELEGLTKDMNEIIAFVPPRARNEALFAAAGSAIP